MAKIQIKLVKSPFGRKDSHIRTVRSLGLGKMNSKAIHEKTPQIMGMIRKVSYLLSVEEVSE